MTAGRKTTISWIVLAAAALALAAFAVWAGLRVWSSLNDDRATLTSTVLAPVSWQPDAADTGRPLEDATRRAIEADYARAWVEWNLAYRNRTTGGLATYFTGPALDAIESSVRDALQAGGEILQTDTGHSLALHLYSADGTIVSFTDTRAEITQIALDSTGRQLLSSASLATYDVVMMLVDGNWRVQNWVRTVATPIDTQPEPVAAAGFASVSDATLAIDGRPFPVAGVNYYPRQNPWDRFWTEYDPMTIDADFDLIAHELKLNTIRIFIPYEQFGGPNVSADMLARLDDLLRRAQDRQLKVIVTLFDFFGGQYDPLHWPDTDRHLAGLIPRFQSNPAILAWDLKNEPDLDDASDAVVDAWLRHTAWKVRSLDPVHLITVGWSDANAAVRVSDVVDAISFHFYRPASSLAEKISALQSQTGGKPLLLSEFGLPTWNSPFFPGGHSEKEQAAYYADILTAVRSTRLAGSLAWTLYDFPAIPETVGGRWPWQAGPEKHLGIVRGDGTLKPAAKLLSPSADLGVNRPSRLDRFLKPFWLATGLAVLGIAGAFWFARRIRGTGPKS
jgi:hypothetical protein